MGIFPENTNNGILNMESPLAEKSSTGFGKSPVFLFDKGDFKMVDGKVYMAEGLEVLKTWIEKVLRTERYRYPIYTGNYGVTLEELGVMNLPREILNSLLKQQITEALLQNPAISTVGNFVLSRDGSCLNISFDVHTVENGKVEMEVGVNV